VRELAIVAAQAGSSSAGLAKDDEAAL